MAGLKIKRGDCYNVAPSEYVITDVADIQYLPTVTSDAKGKFADNPDFETRPIIGSTCQVVTGAELIVYMLGEDGWFEI